MVRVLMLCACLGPELCGTMKLLIRWGVGVERKHYVVDTSRPQCSPLSPAQSIVFMQLLLCLLVVIVGRKNCDHIVSLRVRSAVALVLPTSSVSSLPMQSRVSFSSCPVPRLLYLFLFDGGGVVGDCLLRLCCAVLYCCAPSSVYGFCVPCANATARHRLDGSSWCMNCVCLNPCAARNIVRRGYGIQVHCS